MADIRYAPGIIDDFTRADELYPPGILPPWAATPGWDLPVSLEGGSIGSPDVDPNYQAQSSWLGGVMGGPQMEAWGIAGGDAPLHDGYYFGFHTLGGVGYYIRSANSVGEDYWQIWRRDAGSAVVIATSSIDRLINGIAPDYCLLQVDGDNLSGYVSTDAGANWTLMVGPVADTTYRVDLYISFGGQGGGPGWTAIGGGPFYRRSQIFRSR